MEGVGICDMPRHLANPNPQPPKVDWLPDKSFFGCVLHHPGHGFPSITDIKDLSVVWER